MIGIGLFVSIPQSAMLLLGMGWLSAREPRPRTVAPPRVAREPRGPLGLPSPQRLPG
jgi:hypothetical protein